MTHGWAERAKACDRGTINNTHFWCGMDGHVFGGHRCGVVAQKKVPAFSLVLSMAFLLSILLNTPSYSCFLALLASVILGLVSVIRKAGFKGSIHGTGRKSCYGFPQSRHRAWHHRIIFGVHHDGMHFGPVIGFLISTVFLFVFYLHWLACFLHQSEASDFCDTPHCLDLA